MVREEFICIKVKECVKEYRVSKCPHRWRHSKKPDCTVKCEILKGAYCIPAKKKMNKYNRSPIR